MIQRERAALFAVIREALVERRDVLRQVRHGAGVHLNELTEEEFLRSKPLSQKKNFRRHAYCQGISWTRVHPYAIPRWCPVRARLFLTFLLLHTGWATASTTLLSLKSLCGGGVPPSSHPSFGGFLSLGLPLRIISFFLSLYC